MTEHAVTPVWQWTHDGDKVLLVKCVNKDGTSYGGFQWPESGPVEAPDWDPEPKCGGGLHGWPWGIGIGAGKEPDYSGRWLVFAADPEDVVWVDDKAKCRKAEVVYCGPWWGAYARILPGREAWIQHAASGAASATGWRGAASATGKRGAASATGWRGAASATGESGAASATGERGAASATGERGAASATGYSGAASATGWRGAASATGESGAASATGQRGAASATGWRGAASATGWRGAASATGQRGAASATGWRGAASATGQRGAASATGWRGAASATGEESIAAVTQATEYSHVEAGPGGIAAVIGEVVHWTVHRQAVLIQRWKHGNGWRTAVLYGRDYPHEKTIRIVRGKRRDD